MKFTVVVPLFNKAPYISRAIRSVLRQCCSDFEVVVVDDGSTDGGGGIVRAIDDPRVRMFSQENQGVSAARNRGVAEARGELIAFLDGDDEWDEGFLAAIDGLHRRYPDAGICATGFRYIFRRGLVKEVTLKPSRDGGETLLVDDYFRVSQQGTIVNASNCALPRRVFDQTGGFKEGAIQGEDRDLFGRIAVRFPVAFDRRILSAYHCEAGGRSSQANLKSAQYPPFIEEAFTIIKDPAVGEQTRRSLIAYTQWLGRRHLFARIALKDREGIRAALEREPLDGPRRFLHRVIRVLVLLLPPTLFALGERAVRARTIEMILPMHSRHLDVRYYHSESAADCGGVQ